MPAYKIEGIPIQVFNFFSPLSHWLKYLLCLFWITVWRTLGLLRFWRCYGDLFSFFSLDLLDLRAISELLDKPASYHFFLWRECRLRQCYRNYSWFTGGIKTFKGGLNCEKLYCPLNVNTWAMESFVVQFRKSKVSSHRRNVHVS